MMIGNCRWRSFRFTERSLAEDFANQKFPANSVGSLRSHLRTGRPRSQPAALIALPRRSTLSSVQITNRANLSAVVLGELERALPEFGTLQQFVLWGMHQQPPALLLDTTPLDEYTHEVISVWQEKFLIFSST